jgi:hypothetical protein
MNNVAASEVYGIGLVAGSLAYCHGVSNITTQGTTNTTSLVDAKPVNLARQTGAFQVETFTDWTSDGMTLNATTRDTTIRKRAVLFVETTAAATETGADSAAVAVSEVTQPITVGVGAVEAG